MRFTTFFILQIVFVFAMPHPGDDKSKNKLPLSTTHEDLTKPVDFEAIERELRMLTHKHQRAFEAYERNTGQKHPLAPDYSDKDKTGSSTSKNPGKGKRDASALVNDHNKQRWLGKISVGTPPKTFIVDVDTGSSDLFLPGNASDSSCNGHTPYQPPLSSTSVNLGETFSLSYLNHSTVSGELYTDTVTVDGYNATSQTLGVATVCRPGLQSSSSPLVGVLGMAFHSMSNYGAKPFFETLISEKKIADPVFSLMLRDSHAELHLGRTDASLYAGNMSYAPVLEKGFWQVSVEDVRGNGQTVLRNVDAIIDTGANVILGAQSEVSALSAALGGTALSGENKYRYYTFACDSFPTLGLTFGGTTFDIEPSVLNLGRASPGSPNCVSGLVGHGRNETMWSIGGMFLRGLYTTFDAGQSRVGFARLK